MNYIKIAVCILLMALVSYVPRVIPLLYKKKITNTFIRSLLTYLPYGILAAMVFPEVLYSTANMISAGIGAAAALITASFRKCGLLTVSVVAVITVYIVELIMTYI